MYGTTPPGKAHCSREKMSYQRVELVDSLISYIFHKIEEDKIGEARTVVTALQTTHAEEPKVLWLAGALSTNRDDTVAVAHKLASSILSHSFQYTIVPDFSSSQQVEYHSPNYRRFIVLGVIATAILFIVSASIIKYAALSTILIVSTITLFSTYGCVLIHEILSVYFLSAVSKFSSRKVQEINLKYWILLLDCAQISLNIMFGKRLRPEPYTEMDNRITSFVQDISIYFNNTKHLTLNIVSQESCHPQVSLKRLLLLEYGNCSISRFLLMRRNMQKLARDFAIIESTLSNIPTLEQQEIDACNRFERIAYEYDSKLPSTITIFCTEGQCTLFEMYDLLTELHSLLDIKEIKRGTHVMLKNVPWPEIAHRYKQYEYVISRLDYIYSATQEISGLRDSSEKNISDILNCLSNWESELNKSFQQSSIYVDDFLAKLSHWRDIAINLKTLPSSPSSYKLGIEQCTELSLLISNARQQYETRQKLVTQIHNTSEIITTTIDSLVKSIRMDEKRLDFTFNLTAKRVNNVGQIYGDLPPLESETNEVILRERLKLLNTIKLDLAETDKMFGKSRIEYTRASSYEDTGKLIEKLLILINKYNLETYVYQNQSLRLARNNIGVVRSIGTKSEDTLDEIMAHFNAARKSYYEACNEIFMYSKSEFEDITKKISGIKKTTNKWSYTNKQRFVQIDKNSAKLRDLLKQIDANEVYDEAKLNLLDKALSVHFRDILEPHQEYIEQLEGLVEQYNRIMWRIRILEGSRGDRIQEDEHKIMLSNARHCIDNALHNETYGGVKDNLVSAEYIVNGIATSPRYQANINGNLQGFAQGDNAKVIFNYAVGNKPDKMQLFEIGTLCAALCLKEEAISKRKKAYSMLLELITTTDIADIFPKDVLYYLARDATLNSIEDILKEAIITCDRIAESIKRKYRRIEECQFRVGFDLYISLVIVNKYFESSTYVILESTIRDLLGSLRSLGRKKDRESTEIILFLLKDRNKLEFINRRLISIQENYIQQFSKESAKSKKV